MRRELMGGHVYRMLIGACNPISRPLRSRPQVMLMPEEESYDIFTDEDRNEVIATRRALPPSPLPPLLLHSPSYAIPS